MRPAGGCCRFSTMNLNFRRRECPLCAISGLMHCSKMIAACSLSLAGPPAKWGSTTISRKQF